MSSTTTRTKTSRNTNIKKTTRVKTSTAKTGRTKPRTYKAGTKRNKTKVVHPLSGKVREYANLIETRGIATYVANLINETNVKSGRPRTFTPKMLLVGLMLLADEGTMHLSRIVQTLNGLDSASKQHLGIGFTVTRRQVEHLYGYLCQVLETANSSADAHVDLSVDASADVSGRVEARFRGLDTFCDKIIEATHHNATKTASIAIDGTAVESWGTRRTNKDTGEIKNTDPDAHWKARSQNATWKRPYFGYELTACVQVPDQALSLGETSATPLFARSIRFRPATHKPVASALDAAIIAHRQIILEGQTPVDVLVDREYSATHDGSGFLNPMRALGFSPVFDLTATQIGVSNLVHGALIIDGQPFSPATPPDLRLLTPPAMNAPLSEKIQYQKKIAARSRYALVRHGRGLTNGAQDYQCPAHAGKIACPLAGIANPLLITAQHAPGNAQAKSVCTKKYTRFHAADLPLDQDEIYGSSEWFFSMSRRSMVEGFFGNLKNEATENLKRGSIRVRGLVKTGVMTLFSVAATNLRLIKNFVAKPRRTARRGRKPKIGIQLHNPLTAKNAGSSSDNFAFLDPPGNADT
jgi:hypothetical protein